MGWASPLILASVAALVTACVARRPTQVTTIWKDPAAGPMRFRKGVVIFVGDDSTLRRQVEDRAAARLGNAVAWPSVGGLQGAPCKSCCGALPPGLTR